MTSVRTAGDVQLVAMTSMQRAVTSTQLASTSMRLALASMQLDRQRELSACNLPPRPNPTAFRLPCPPPVEASYPDSVKAMLGPYGMVNTYGKDHDRLK